jgi:radical SAM superfamily enzyme YgiQ (UPF0313 family)
MISIDDSDFFGTPERPKEVMRALKGRGVHWQAGVTSKLAQDDRMLELAAESGCTLMSIGFESITRSTLTSVHKHVNRPETFISLVEKVHSYGIMVFGLFMFGLDGDDPSVFEETVKFCIGANYDACAFSVLTPYPGTLTWYDLKKAERIVSFDWSSTISRTWSSGHKHDRRRAPAGPRIRLRDVLHALVIARASRSRTPNRLQWAIYNLFMKKGAATDRKAAVAAPRRLRHGTRSAGNAPKREWREAVLEGIGTQSLERNF